MTAKQKAEELGVSISTVYRKKLHRKQYEKPTEKQERAINVEYARRLIEMELKRCGAGVYDFKTHRGEYYG